MKVTISLPDELLTRVDAHARTRGSTRSATISELVEFGLGERPRPLSEQLLALRAPKPEPDSGAVGDVTADRPS